MKCIECGHELAYEEQLEIDGGFSVGWIEIVGLYHCEHCNEQYEISLMAPIKMDEIRTSIKKY